MQKSPCYLFLLFFLIQSQQLLSQTVIELDFDTKSYKNWSNKAKALNSLEEGDLYQLKINNINTFLYKIAIENVDSVSTGTLSLPTFASLSTDGLSSLLSSVTPLATSLIQPAQPKAELKTFAIDNTRANSSLKQIKKELNKEQNILKATAATIKKDTDNWGKITSDHLYQKDPTFNFDQFVNKKPKYASYLSTLETNKKTFKERIEKKYKVVLNTPSIKTAFNKILTTYDEQIKYLKTAKEKSFNIPFLKNIASKRINYEKTLLDKNKTALNSIKNKIDNWALYADRIYACMLCEKKGKCGNDCNTMMKDSILIRRQRINKKIAQLEADLGSQKTAYLNEMAEAKKFNAFKDKDDVDKAHQKLLASYEELNKLLLGSRASTNAEQTKTMLVMAAAVANNSSYSYTSLPMQVNGNESILKIKIEPRDEHYLLNSYATELHFPKNPSFVLGTGSSFYIAGLQDDIFSLKGDTSAAGGEFLPIQEDTAPFETGMYAHFNFAWTFGSHKKCGIGGSVGPGISFTKTIRPRILGGLSLSYGKKNQLSIGVGGIAGYVDKKSNIIDDPIVPLNAIPESLTVSAFEGSWYFSIGFFRTI